MYLDCGIVFFLCLHPGGISPARASGFRIGFNQGELHAHVIKDRARFGVNGDDLRAKRCTPAFRELLRFEVDRTRELFHRGLPLVAMMPMTLRAQVELFARGGLAILRKIEQQDYDVFARRPKLAKWEKAMLIARAFGRRLRARVTA